MTKPRFEKIAELIREWQPVLLVVGLSVHADGAEHEITRLCQRFARRLEGRFGIPVVMEDERYTTVIARLTLEEVGITGRKQRPVLDQIAAQHILQTFLIRPMQLPDAEQLLTLLIEKSDRILPVIRLL